MIFAIALRYLLAKKSHRVVNVISSVSIAGVAVATAAIVVVLSVFNGFTRLATTHLSTMDPDVKILPVNAKVIASGDSMVSLLESRPEIGVAMPVLQERALLTAGDSQLPVIVKGVDPQRVGRVIDLPAIMIDGVYSPDNGMPDSIAGAQLAVGVAVSTGLRPSPYCFADIYMPRRLGRINPANPAAAYRSLPVAVTGVFRIDQPEYDGEYVLAPLSDVRRLLEYEGGEASAIEVMGSPGVSASEVENAVRSVVGEDYEVLGRDRQQAETFRMIAVEKWVTFLMLVFILIIASFNIVSTLSLMVIEKRDNMMTLRALGATRRDVQNIFIAEGWLITVFGGVIGCAAGVILALAQEHFGLIKLAADPTALTIDVYPVVLQWSDVALVLAAVAIVGMAIGFISRIFTRKIS